jgi:predicted P-type ATPase
LNQLKNELLQPIYFFQFALILMWMIVKHYYAHGILILIITLAVIIGGLVASSKNNPAKFLSELVKNTGREVLVIRDGQSFMVGSAGLVPGDVIEINSKITLPCDFVLVKGSVELDESELTGDTSPAQKVSAFTGTIDSNAGNRGSIRGRFAIHQENTLIGGSKVLSYKSIGDEAPLAVVIRTGFNASRGRLIRQFLLNQENSTHAYVEEIFRFSISLIVVGMLSILFTALFSKFGNHGFDPFVYKPYLDLVMTVCPPFVPLVTFIPIFVAKRNMRKFEVQSRGGGSGNSLMKFGLIDCVCYDKTGTLTESSLSLHGVVQTSGGTRFKEDLILSVKDMSQETIMVMAACHNLFKANHMIAGDRLEEELFTKTDYDLKREKNEARFVVTNEATNSVIQVTNIYPFSSYLQRTTVVVRAPHFCVLSKGSPNSIRKICKPDTIPNNFNELVRAYGLRGFRLIAYAKRQLSDDLFFKNMTSRDEAEKEMSFLGFFVMKNQLHPHSESEVIAMKNSNILCKMITGDSIYTAISVAKDCCLVDSFAKVLVAEIQQENEEIGIIWKNVHDGTIVAQQKDSDNGLRDGDIELAITGEAFSLLRNYWRNDTQKIMYYKLITRCHIFGEMLPTQKAELVNDLKDMDFFVSMVGDGSNDSLALIASDVGFSLSEAETSFASEFSANVDHCLCSFMIRQARCLLDKILVNFKFVLLYILTQYTVTLHNNITTLKERQLIWSSFFTGFLLLVSSK